MVKELALRLKEKMGTKEWLVIAGLDRLVPTLVSPQSFLSQSAFGCRVIANN